jgi:hypothetical protein
MAIHQMRFFGFVYPKRQIFLLALSQRIHSFMKKNCRRKRSFRKLFSHWIILKIADAAFETFQPVRFPASYVREETGRAAGATAYAFAHDCQNVRLRICSRGGSGGLSIGDERLL